MVCELYLNNAWFRSRMKPCALKEVKVKSLQSCPTLCDPVDGSLSGSCVHGILQARVLEWGAIAFSIVPFIILLT